MADPRAPSTRRAVLQGAAGGLMVGLAAKTAAGASLTQPAVVATPGGRLKGIQNAGVQAFKGVRYGRTTGAEGRYRDPRPAPAWTGVRDALAFGAPCIQNNHDFPAWVDPVPASEDCLFLNVWTPFQSGSGLRPVMVWIHGGGYSSGSGGLDIYDGSNLARRGDVVVVTLNHRLNVFGYLHLSGVDPNLSDAMNLGQKDLILALEWVRDNIAAFGGDRGNVTLFGESGGGGKITALCAMPQAKGLFHKAIIESGSLLQMSAADEAEAVARAVLAELDLAPSNAAALLDAPAERLRLAAEAVERKSPALAFRPVVDGRSLPAQPWSPGAPELARDVAMIIGTNSEETAAFLPDMGRAPADDVELAARIAGFQLGEEHLSEAEANRRITIYRGQTPGASRLELLVRITTDAWLWKGALLQAERKARQGRAPVYMYEFTWKTPCFGAAWALHGLEIPFVFGNLRYASAWDGHDSDAERRAADPTGKQYQLMEQMTAAWAAFAHSGSPSAQGLPAWPAYDLSDRPTMIFSENRVDFDFRPILRQLVTPKSL